LTNTSKLREFVEELKRLKVEVVRPCINECFAEFKAETNKIFYGLGAIKSVGFEAISNIIKEREKNGKFKSMIDFIKRADPKNTNKLQLEGLVKAGAFDTIEINRKKLFVSIPKIIQTIKNNYDDKISNQTNLFEGDFNNENEQFEYETCESWSKKELLLEEFKSLGFYISDHPLNEYKDLFSQLKIKSYKEFMADDLNESLVAGTIMSIQEKKSAKGTAFAIVKFSDNSSEFEIFLFSELLINNREILKESNSFVLTLQKDKQVGNNGIRRVNIRKILSLDEMINKPYENVSIELNPDYDLEELTNTLKEEGETQINIIVRDKNKSFAFKLEKTRKFDLNIFNEVKNKQYVKKISF
jgi:DNA polymerase-3 subunit alpha